MELLLLKKLEELSNKEYRFSKYQMFLILVLIFVCGGIFGFIYETVFYKIDLGYFVKRGSTFGPWIPIYGYGAILITIVCNKLKKKPIIILLLSAVVCGALEYLVGYLLLNIGHIRLWDYNTEILNFGNIGGFICLRSILFFGFSGLFLIYGILPSIKYLCNKVSVKIFSYISLIPGILFVFDLAIYGITKYLVQ